jgi:hypothetical protein
MAKGHLESLEELGANPAGSTVVRDGVKVQSSD